MSKPNTVLVLGATGQQGSAVCKYLSQEGGIKVLAATRDTNSVKAKELSALPNVTAVAVDTSNPEGMFSQPVDALFFMMHSQTPDELALTKTIIDAAAKHGVKYVVYSGVDLSGVPKTGIDSFDVKRDGWAYLRAQPVKSTFVGPAGFLETLFWPDFAAYTQDWDPAYVHKYIATDDIGHIAALCLADPDKYEGRKLMIAGDAVNRQEFKRVWDEVMPDNKLEKKVPDGFVKHMFTQLEQNPFEADPEACRKEFPFMSTVRDWLEKVYKPAQASHK